jgi:ribosome-binding protein aMBF1 (putative translation factor)
MNDNNFISTLSFGRQLCLARQTCNYTIHEFSQMCNMKLRLIEDYENDVSIPEKKTIAKMNKYLKNKLPYAK